MCLATRVAYTINDSHTHTFTHTPLHTYTHTLCCLREKTLKGTTIPVLFGWPFYSGCLYLRIWRGWQEPLRSVEAPIRSRGTHVYVARRHSTYFIYIYIMFNLSTSFNCKNHLTIHLVAMCTLIDILLLDLLK